MEHDAYGNLVGVEYPDGSRLGYSYDAAHLLRSRTNERGHTWSYRYDDYGHVQGVTLPDGAERGLRDRVYAENKS